jgi:hypothetical protein
VSLGDLDGALQPPQGLVHPSSLPLHRGQSSQWPRGLPRVDTVHDLEDPQSLGVARPRRIDLDSPALDLAQPQQRLRHLGALGAEFGAAPLDRRLE